MITIKATLPALAPWGLSGMPVMYTVRGGKVDRITAPASNPGSGYPGYVFRLDDDVTEGDFLATFTSAHKVADIS